MDLLGKIFALSTAILWAFSVILFKKAGHSIKPAALNLYKTVIAVILLLPLLFIFQGSFIPGELLTSDWVKVIASGILGIAIADSLFFKCLNLLGAGMTAIVDCLYSPFIIILSWFLLSTGVTIYQAIGVICVTMAVLVAAFKKNETHNSARQVFLGIAFGALAMFFMALSIILMKPVLDKTSILWVTEFRLLAAMIILIPIVLLRKNRKEMFRSMISRLNWKHAFPATILGNFLAMTLWVWAFKLTDINSAAILNQTNTIFILIFASLFLREPFTKRRLLATFLGVAGSLLVLIR